MGYTSKELSGLMGAADLQETQLGNPSPLAAAAEYETGMASILPGAGMLHNAQTAATEIANNEVLPDLVRGAVTSAAKIVAGPLLSGMATEAGLLDAGTGSKFMDSSIVSGVLGITNSIVGLGRSIGVTDAHNLDEEDTIEALYGAETSNFYARHKQAADVTGMLVTSVGIYSASVAGLRALQVAGKLGGTYELATGMTNADIVLGSKAVADATKAVTYGVESWNGAFSAPMISAYAQGAKQAILENIVGVTVISILGNQNIVLNPEGELKGAVESSAELIKDNLTYGWFWGGTAVQGVGEGLKALGHVKKAFSAVEQSALAAVSPMIKDLGSFAGVSPGDALLMAKKANAIGETPEFLAVANDPAIAGYARKAKEALSRSVDEQMLRVTEGIKDPAIKELAVKELRGLVYSPLEVDSAPLLSALKDVSHVGDEAKMAAFYRKTSTPMFLYELAGGNKADVESELGRLFADSITPAMEKEGYVAHDADKVAGIFAEALSRRMGNARGIAFANSDIMAQKEVNWYELFKTAKTPDGGTVPLGTLLYRTPDSPAIAGNLEIMNDARRMLGLPELTNEEAGLRTFLHELGHYKNNNAKLEDLLKKRVTTQPEVIDELHQLSMHARPEHWRRFSEDMFHLGNTTSPKELLQPGSFSKFLQNPKEVIWLNRYDGGVTEMPELLADAVSVLMHPKTRETAPRFAPKIAALIKQQGSLAMPWSDTRLFYNIRTGMRDASVLPGIADTGRATLKGTNSILVKGFNGKEEIFGYDHSIFNYADISDPTANLLRTDYRQASAMWVAKHDADVWKSATLVKEKAGAGEVLKARILDIHVDDLPAIERAIVAAKDHADDLSRIRFIEPGKPLGAPVTMADATKELMNTKKALRLQYAKQGYNEQEIRHILNIDESLATGGSKGEWLMYNATDYSKPEVIQMNYAPVDVRDINIKARSEVQHDVNIADSGARVQKGAAQLLDNGEYERLPNPDFSGRSEISQVDSRVGMANAAKNKFGSVREKAAAIGKVASDLMRESADIRNKGYSRFAQLFQAPESFTARAELASMDNLIRASKSVLIKDADNGTYALVGVDDLAAIHAATPDWGAMPMLHMLDAVDAETFQKYANFAKAQPSKEVGEFLEHQRNINRGIVRSKKIIAGVRGETSSLDGSVLYAAPMDLKATPHVAFVVPTDSYGDHDPRKFMVYGSTAQELQEKVNSIYASTPHYKVVYGGKGSDVELYKKLVGDYDAGNVFDEQFFDSAKFKKGSSAQLKVNMDLHSSSTFNRYVNWTIKQDEYRIRSGIELKYSDKIAELERMDQTFSKSEQGLFGAKVKPTIYRDTKEMMLDIRGSGGEGQQLYKKVSDWVGKTGSEALGKAFGAVRDLKTPITQEDFNKISARLDAAGIQMPYSSVTEMIVSSPDIVANRQLHGIVRSMNSIVSTLGIRLDQANSIVQLTSAPILGTPVLREAMQNMPAGKAREGMLDLVRVKIPGTDLYEPSAAKLQMMAAKSLFSAEGKLRMEKYRTQKLVSDHFMEYLGVFDDMALSGNHSVGEAMQKFDRAAKFASKWLSGNTFVEDFTRYTIADSIERIGLARGLTADEIYVSQINAIDQVHGVHRYSARPQLFNGVVGQAIGLYQTYSFNMMHSMARYVQDGNKANAAIMAGLQTSIYGLQGLPGFKALNESIGRSNGNHLDAYNVTGADVDDKGLGSYLLYGAASHLLSTPIDLAGRGGMSPRNPLLVPTDFADIPAVSIFAKGIKNIYDTGVLLAEGNLSVGQSLLHGLAHNGFNRQLQGIADTVRGYTDSAQGQPMFTNANHTNYDELEELNAGAMTARLLGTRPLKESILINTKYRNDAYQLSHRKKSESLGEAVKLTLAAGGKLTPQMVQDYAKAYEAAGLEIEGFNAFWGRQLAAVGKEDMVTFKRTLEQDKVTQRTLARMKAGRAKTKPWDEMQSVPPKDQGMEQAAPVDDAGTFQQ